MPISNNGLNFIKKWEAFEGEAYQDQAGIWTIGYGTTMYMDGTKVREGDTIEEANAAMYLMLVCDGIARKITNWINKPLSQTQLDSLA